MILGMGASELVVILLVALVIFGPKNLPKLGASMGKTVKNFREGMEGDDEPKAETKAEAAETVKTKKTAEKKTAAKKSTAKKATTKKTATKKTAAKKTTTKKAATKKTTAKKTTKKAAAPTEEPANEA